MQAGQRAFLFFQFLQQFGFEVRPACDLMKLEQRHQRHMVFHAEIAFQKMIHALEQILEAQPGTHFFAVEGEFVADHFFLGIGIK